MGARLIIADVHDGLATLEPGSVDFICSSPPFLAVRSYLPGDHPDKAKEIGSEATPADYLDTLLDVTEACARVLAPHGSLAFELGDTYSGSTGGGGDYQLREVPAGQRATRREGFVRDGIVPNTLRREGNGWPLDKSLCGIPTLFAWSLAYGRNLLRPERTTPPWRIRTLKAWIRTNPPVGALGDKERPATSYIVVATKAKNRWFDLDAVRTPSSVPNGGPLRSRAAASGVDGGDLGHEWDVGERLALNAAGAPPLDWWTHIDAVLDNELARTRHQTGEAVSFERGNEKHVGDTNRNRPAIKQPYAGTRPGATGAHLRRALQAAGILHLEEAIDQSPGGYSGAHYAVWPPELAAQLVQEMCPRQVCRRCGEPRRRVVVKHNDNDARQALADHLRERRETAGLSVKDVAAWFPSKTGGLTGCVSNWETNANVPTAEQWPILKGRLGLSDEYDDVVLGERQWTESLVEYEHLSDDPSGWTQDSSGRVYQRLNARKDRLPVHQWSDCGHGGDWRPGLVLDPFAGSGTTLAVAHGHGRDTIGIDIDSRNVDLARGRLGMFLEVDEVKS